MNTSTQCPDPSVLQKLVNGDITGAPADTLFEHVTTCPPCLEVLQSIAPVDTLENSLTQATVHPDGPEESVVQALIAKIKSAPVNAVSPDQTLDSVSPPSSSIPIAETTQAPELSQSNLSELTASVDDDDDDTEAKPWEFLAPAKAPDEIGRLGPYRILQVLGQGGMGIVFRAEDINLKRPVALKAMLPSIAASSAARKRFIREAQTAARISHDHIVTIHQVGEDRGVPFLAMEFLKGEPLDVRLKREKTLPVNDILRISREMAEGLAAAHDLELIHRDIKPANIWLETRPNGVSRTKILDFGLARASNDDAGLTKSGVIMGTPSYMAPEQASGKPVDLRADLFSLGCTMYAMCLGYPPFKGTDTISTLMAVATFDPPTARSIRPDIPVELSQIIDTLLSKQADKRPQTAHAVVESLRTMQRAMERTDHTVVVPAAAVVPVASDAQLFELPSTPVKKSSKDKPEAAAKVDSEKKPTGKAKSSSKGKPTPKAEEKAKKSLLLPILGIALGAILALGAVAVVASQLLFTTKDGTLVVEVDNDADVRFKKGKLEIYDDQGVLKYTLEPSEKNKTLPPGRYALKVTGADGVKLETEKFEMEKKGKVLVRVKAIAPKDVATKPPVQPPVKPPVPSNPGGHALKLYYNGTAVEGPSIALDTQKPWTAEGYITPLTDAVALTNGTIFGANEGFGLGVFKGAYFGYSRHGEATGGVVKTGERVHLACVQTETTRSLFVNGKLVQKVDNPLPPDKKQVGNLIISLLNYVENAPPVECLIDNLRVSQSVRYTQEFTPPGRHTPDKETLLLYYCDEGEGEKLTDSSGNGYHAKILNAKWSKASTTSAKPPATQPGVPVNLRKPSWKPGPAENILPGMALQPTPIEGLTRWQLVPSNIVTEMSRIAFSPDQKWVALSDMTYLRIYDSSTGELKAIGKRNGNQPGFGESITPTWSPDSMWVRMGDQNGTTLKNASLFAVDGTPSKSPGIPHASLDIGWNPKFPVFACVLNDKPDVVQVIDPSQEKSVEINAKIGLKGKATWTTDGVWLIVAREDKTAQLYNRNGEGWNKLAGEVDPSVAPVCDTNIRLIAALVSPNEVGFWNMTGTSVAKTGKHDKPILGIHWNPDGQSVAVSTADRKRHFWKIDGTSLGSVDTNDDTPGFVWANNGKGFFTPGKYWPTVGKQEFTDLKKEKHDELISPDQNSIIYSHGGQQSSYVAEWKDGVVRNLDFSITHAFGWAPIWSQDGTRFAISTVEGITIYDARDPKKQLQLGGGGRITDLRLIGVSPQGNRIVAIGSRYGNIMICDPTGRVIRQLPRPSGGGHINGFCWRPDGKYLAVFGTLTHTTVFDTETGKEVATTAQGASSGFFSTSNPDELVIAHRDVFVWNWKTEKDAISRVLGVNGEMKLSPDGKQIAVCGGNDKPALLLSADLKQRKEIPGVDLAGAANTVGPPIAWMPDSKRLLVGSTPITIRDLDGKILETIKETDGLTITSWALSEDNQFAYGFNLNSGIQLNLTDLKLTKLGQIRCYPELQNVPSSDGQYVIQLDGDTVHYWSLASQSIVQSVSFLPKGEFVTLSPAGEILEASANAGNYLRYIVEDKAGKLLVKTPAEMAGSLPPSLGGMPPLDPAWIKSVAAMPPEKQYEAVIAEVKARNPEFTGKGPRNGRVIEAGVVAEVTLDGKLADVTPVRALPGLKRFSVCNTPDHNAIPLPLTDLTQLQGMKLTHLSVWQAAATDLTPLKGMPLTKLEVLWMKVTDLTPLAGMPLEYLDLRGCPVQDLTPIKGLKLKVLGLLGTQVADLKAVVEMPLESLECGGRITDLTLLKGKKLKLLRFDGDVVSDLSPLKGMPLDLLGWWGSKVTDLSPLEGMPLKNLEYELNLERDGKILRSLKSLETINGKPANEVLNGK